MLGRIRSHPALFVSVVLVLFAAHFVTGIVCRANPDPKVNDRFDAYLKPGVLVLAAPFLVGRFGGGTMLGVLVYFGAMFVYSVLLTLGLFAIYEALRR